MPVGNATIDKVLALLDPKEGKTPAEIRAAVDFQISPRGLRYALKRLIDTNRAWRTVQITKSDGLPRYFAGESPPGVMPYGVAE